ncbi:MAG: HAMP domain-containing histidine kinase [Alphaproteobacteria bacterium]|nr:HAMP domain-containing histidine kinase [Alphaproteobacteria bacterium]
MMISFSTISVNKGNLKLLIILRIIAIFSQIATIGFVYFLLKITLPILPMILAIGFLAIVNIRAYFKFKKNIITDKGLFLELLFDVCIFALQIYLSGGASNPFISLFLIQIIIAIILLRPLFYWLIAIISVIFYVLLGKFYYRNIDLQTHNHHQGDFSLHLQGMLFSYLILAILLIIFIGKIIRNIQLEQQKIYTLQQQSLQEKHLVEMGLFATNSAHNLSTPLSTILLSINHLKENLNYKKFDDDFKLIEKQIFRCKNIISDILNYSGAQRLENSESLNLRQSSIQLIENWHSHSLVKNLHINYFGDSKINFSFDKTLANAIYNILDNSFESYINEIIITIYNDQKNIIFSIIDDGKGFEKRILKKLGQKNISTKNSNGLGIYLTINTLEKIGGNFIALNLKDKGSMAKIIIPINHD